LFKIDGLLEMENKDKYEPPEWMKIEKLQEEWQALEDAEQKREASLNTRLELIELEEKANRLKNWIRDQSNVFGKRNYTDSDQLELKNHQGGLDEFRQNIKPQKKRI